jgi:plastocyanin
MVTRARVAIGLIALLAAAVLVVPALVSAGPDSSATVQFGNPDVGSPFPPPTFQHDASSHARDNLIPRTVVISAGGTVTFNIVGFHQPAIYAAGTTPGDITVPAFPPNLFINDSNGRLALGPLNVPPATSSFQYTFATPGRYLVICNVTPHFAIDGMYGWVIVQ